MKLNSGLHLTCCTNASRNATWAETFEALQHCVLPLRQQLNSTSPLAVGFRLCNHAAHQLAHRATLLQFQRWLDQHLLYVFSLNGFAHGNPTITPRREQLYTPDWTSPQRVAYTNCLLDLLSQLLPENVKGSVSTLPGSYKGFPLHGDDLRLVRRNVWLCVEHAARLSEQTGRTLQLALEPEPLCLLESSGETIHFFDRMRSEHPRDPRLESHLGVNYDTCHFAVEFEEARNAIFTFYQHNIRICKMHLSSALMVRPTEATRQKLAALPDDDSLHQVVVRRADGNRFIYFSVQDALSDQFPEGSDSDGEAEWRIHYHLPLCSPPGAPFLSTHQDVLDALDVLGEYPDLCTQLELEPLAWNFIPAPLCDSAPSEQVAAEYQWTLARLAERGLA